MTITYVATPEPADYPLLAGRLVRATRVQAWLDGKVIGSLYLDSDGLHVSLSVHPKYRRQGVATGMFYAAKEAGLKPRKGARNINAAAQAWADTLDWS